MSIEIDAVAKHTQVAATTFVAHIRRLAAEQPDFIYARRGPLGTPEHDGPACRYAFEGYPDCLIGRALHATGVQLSELEELDKLDISKARGVLGRFGIGWHVAKWAGAVQDWQDRGHSRAEAVDFADRSCPLEAAS